MCIPSINSQNIAQMKVINKNIGGSKAPRKDFERISII